MAQEGAALVGDEQPARLTVEEDDAKIVFKRADRLGHGRLRNRQGAGGTGNGTRLGGRDEELELAEGKGHARIIATAATGGK